MEPPPLFLIGTGRCGSSILAHILSHHPQLSFLTPVASYYPRRLYLNRWMLRCRYLPGGHRVPGAYTQLSEAYNFWEEYAQGFSNPCRDLTAQDVTERKARSLRDAVAETMIPSRPRFFAKLTGWSRIGFLRAVFPGARFVHLVRDGRDVANSMVHVPFWDGWKGPGSWRYGRLSDADRKSWEEHDRSFVLLAGLAWKTLVASVEEARRNDPDAPVHDVRYEDFLADPVSTMEEIASALELPLDEALVDRVREIELRDQRGRHRKDLSADHVETLTEVLREDLARYGYL